MQIEVITPDLAQKYLEANTRNRAVSQMKVAEHAKTMHAGKWVLNGQTIVFDDEGVLIDGQHRLHACVQAKTPFVTYVIKGVSDPRAFTTIDVGKTRGASDMATYMGGLSSEHAKHCVAAAKIVRAYDSLEDKSTFLGFNTGCRHDNEQTAAYTLSLCPLLLECVMYSGRRFKTMADRSVVSACCYLFARVSKEESFAFFDLLHDGVFSSATHPIKVLRDTLLMGQKSGKKTRREANGELMAIFFKAWAAYRKGKEVKILRWSREGVNCERFPELAQ